MGDEPDVLKALKYRTQVNQYAQSFLNVIASYMTGFTTNLDELLMPEPDGDEERAIEALYDESKALAVKIRSFADAIIEALSNDLVTNPIDPDLSTFIDAVQTAILAEIQAGDETIAEFRALLKTIVDLALLDSSYAILSSDSVLIENAVDGFISRTKSEADTKFARIDRQTINELDLDGVLDSDIGAEIIARTQMDKVRAYLEIEYKGEELRLEWTNDALDRAIERVRTKVQAGGILPTDLLRLPPALYDLLGDLARKRFLDRNAFVNAYPSMLTNALNGLADTARIWQQSRFKGADYPLDVGKTIIDLFGLVTTNLQSIAGAVAKMSTFEAS